MRVAPTGTVTFLFTDIEGSTRLWETDSESMSEALARHDELLKSAIETRGGYVFKTVGDAFCAAFGTATDALEAALASQRALLEEGWADEIEAIRVRMALHAGEAEERGGDYFGPTLNRVARLLSTGHGGQILVSRAARELAGDRLPPGTSLEDLGEQRLKDLTRPERIFQVLAPELPTDFPALKTLDARRTNLPAQPTALVGREREISEVCGRMREPGIRLLTLTGPGGTGKTRLGLQAAADLLDEHRDGVFFVALADINDTALVPTTMAGALGVVESAELPLEDVLKEYLGRRELLLVLDNFEQVLDAAPLVGKLLSACPKLKVLATSRATLRVYGEQEYPVPPLTLPDPGRLPPVEMLERYEAVRLFAERARAVKPGFVLDGDAPAVAEICARLDGLPLAIELAAARTRLLPPKAMLKRLGDRLKFLTGGARDLPGRQQTLRGAIGWSHDLLDEEDRHLFRRMSVFAGGRTLEAMEAICDAEGDLDVFAAVESLLEKSLIRQEEGPEDEPRFVMLETIHEFAREKLGESAEAEEIKRAHAEFFLALAEEAEPELTGPDQAAWFRRLEAEHDNVRAALSWASGGGDAELGLRLLGALMDYWLYRGHLSEGASWLEQALHGDRGASVPVRAKALLTAGALGNYQADHKRSESFLEESAALYREIDDKRGLARALSGLGNNVADWGDWRRADTLYQESVDLARDLRDKKRVSQMLNNLGWAALCQEDYERATEALQEGLAVAQSQENQGLVGAIELNLGWVALGQGDHARASALFGEALERFRMLEDPVNIAECLEGSAGLAGAQGEGERAARLYGAAASLRKSLGAPLLPGDRPRYERQLSAARSLVAEDVWEAAWLEGHGMTLQQAVSYALGEGTEGKG
ncbi:MAG: tetratricopeptide repeat protein [Actinomycetota bacterium]|nr:tetratricopeptide repeat protein [Actinomycetota bacterium]